MMLAFYLAVPEVENDRRALNVIHGMRRARKEGRFMGIAPIGYANKKDESGRKYISPIEPRASIMREAFQILAKRLYNTEQVYKMCKKMGFNRCKGQFWFAIRNPVYAGKIFIPQYKDEEAGLVKGQHEAIISEALFYEVQDVLDGNKRQPYKLKVISEANLPLRGFLLCPKCAKLLTGSASRGCKGNYYPYYHYQKPCKERFPASKINEIFQNELNKYVPREEALSLFKTAVMAQWEKQESFGTKDKKEIENQVTILQHKLDYVNDLPLSKQIEPEDYREMKEKHAEKLRRLRSKLAGRHDENIDIAEH